MTTYCGTTWERVDGKEETCGEEGPTGRFQCGPCAFRDGPYGFQVEPDTALIEPDGAVNTADDALVKAIARVAHESVAAHNSAYGDYTTPPWERLPEKDKDHTCAKVAAFLNNPDLHPTAHHGTSVAVLTASQRAAAYVFHGVVHAIAREQSRD